MTSPIAGLPHPLIGGAFDSPVPPGSGWPDEPADASTPVSHRATDVQRLAGEARTVEAIDAAVSVCRACPRLVAWRETVAREKRRSFAAEPYWGRPISGWGSSSPSVLVVGLAPAAHGGTGPDESSPATGRATGSTEPCTEPAWRCRRRATTPATVRS